MPRCACLHAVAIKVLMVSFQVPSEPRLVLPGGTGNSVSIRSNIQEQRPSSQLCPPPSLSRLLGFSKRNHATNRPKRSAQVRAEGLGFMVHGKAKSPELVESMKKRSGLSVKGCESDQLTSVS
jgi:hypothetical protein